MCTIWHHPLVQFCTVLNKAKMLQESVLWQHHLCTWLMQQTVKCINSDFNSSTKRCPLNMIFCFLSTVWYFDMHLTPASDFHLKLWSTFLSFDNIMKIQKVTHSVSDQWRRSMARAVLASIKDFNQYTMKSSARVTTHLCFPKVCFWKVYFTKAYFAKVYFLKVYFTKVYFTKVYFTKVYFTKV